MTILTTSQLASNLVDYFVAQGVAFSDSASLKTEVAADLSSWLGGADAVPASLAYSLATSLQQFQAELIQRYDFWTGTATGGPHGDGTYDLSMPDGTVQALPCLAKLVQSTYKGDPGGIVFNFSSATADADPGSGTVRFNNATLASVTQVYIDNLEAGGGTISPWIASFGVAPSANKGVLAFQQVGSDNFAIFMVTGPTVSASGYSKVPVSYLAGPSALTNGSRLTTVFAPAGTKGDSILNGHGAPSNTLGANGDIYLNIDTGDFYGPKAGGAWGTPILAAGLNTLVSQAAGSATAAAGSATAASGSASAAATSATAAAGSATAASGSASAASTSETHAATSAAAAAGFASAASTSETNAAESESAAAASATAASTSETNAAASASAASTSESNAATSASDAATYASQAKAAVGDDYIETVQKGAANGVATLDSSGQVPAGQLGNITKASIGLDQVNNTSDADKPISTAQATDAARMKGRRRLFYGNLL